MTTDILIVGAGLTGATIARLLTDTGAAVRVIDSRPEVGGNCHDQVHPCGLRFHTHGPHYFRTNSERIWSFVNRFAEFLPWEARVRTESGGEMLEWPLHRQHEWGTGFVGTPANFEQAALAHMPEAVYRKWIKPYTEKQWGCPADQLDAGLAKRFDVRTDGDTRLSRAKWQGIPKDGYTAMIARMLEGIEVRTSTPFEPSDDGMYVVYTGPIDAYFGYSLGRLRYRTQRRLVRLSRKRLPAVQVNHPGADTASIRTIDWSHLPGQPAGEYTILTDEFPDDASDAGECEYPFPDAQNAMLYAQYRAMANEIDNVTICGRLGEFRYYDMDICIARSMEIAADFL